MADHMEKAVKMLDSCQHDKLSAKAEGRPYKMAYAERCCFFIEYITVEKSHRYDIYHAIVIRIIL